MDSEEASATLQHAIPPGSGLQVAAAVHSWDMLEVGVSCLGWSLLPWLLSQDSGNKK